MRKFTALLSCLLMVIPFVAEAKTFYVTDRVLVGVYEQSNAQSPLIKALPTGTPLEITETKGEYVKISSPDGTKGWVERSYLIETKPSQLAVLELSDNISQLKEQLSLSQSELVATQTQLKTLTLSVGNDDSKAQLTKHAATIKKLTKSNTTLSKNNKALAKSKDALDKSLTKQKVDLEKSNKKIASLSNQIDKLNKDLKKKQTTQSSVVKVAAVATEENSAEINFLKAKNKEMDAVLNNIRQAMSLPATATTSSAIVESNGLNIKWTWLLLSIVLLTLAGFIGGVKWLDWRNLQRHGGFRI